MMEEPFLSKINCEHFLGKCSGGLQSQTQSRLAK
jgi:hypothetical protein